MTELKIEIKNKIFHFHCPDKYNELNEEQFLRVIELFVLNDIQLEHRLSDSILLLESLLRETDNKEERKKTFFTIDNLVRNKRLHDLLQLLDFLKEKQDFNRWIIKDITVNRLKFYGPKDYFSYMKFGEFIVADMLFLKYFESENEHILNKLIAVLYREEKVNFNEKSNKDRREDFTGDFIDYRTGLFNKLHNIKKQAILFNYAGVRYWLTKKYPFVFQTNENKQEINRIELGKNNNGWMNIRRHLAGNVLNLEKADNLLLSDVLNELNEEMSK